uniref:Uncharacterized protein n=1 Tax=Aegilops tauschii subsp. strangulata TaxID=200361 RepID=A0A453T4H1_AEGTS
SIIQFHSTLLLLPFFLFIVGICVRHTNVYFCDQRERGEELVMSCRSLVNPVY